MGCPVMFDATHSVQKPGGRGSCSGGNRAFALPLMRAAAAIGTDAIFMEVHPRPDEAKCDGPNSLRLSDVREALSQVYEIDKIVREKTGFAEIRPE